MLSKILNVQITLVCFIFFLFFLHLLSHPYPFPLATNTVACCLHPAPAEAPPTASTSPAAPRAPRRQRCCSRDCPPPCPCGRQTPAARSDRHSLSRAPAAILCYAPAAARPLPCSGCGRTTTPQAPADCRSLASAADALLCLRPAPAVHPPTPQAPASCHTLRRGRTAPAPPRPGHALLYRGRRCSHAESRGVTFSGSNSPKVLQSPEF
ncbi:hypothetical protein C2845_PM01G15400 [Panicum miliaceum]|uniref:Uncharacterized protein n=1 Tax=Panicum miliaceum TaxID=4540 RepID=A0A3L6TGU0_PANMI|nr:hypothetical protein C2845_PM01G15400 [Panicum miliaceum]